MKLDFRNAAANWLSINRSTYAVALAMLATVSLAVVLGPWAHSTQNEARLVGMEAGKTPAGDEIATFSGGCFWAMQAMFSRLKGVDNVEAGYAGGHAPHPTYEEVCTETTGYAETVQIAFDPKVISYRDLVTIFFHVHNPTTPNQQGDDVGTSYRSIIFYHDAAQKATDDSVIAQVTKDRLWSDPIVTEVVPYASFYKAEQYHQDYFAHNPDTGYCRFVVAPKVAKFREEYKDRLKPGG